MSEIPNNMRDAPSPDTVVPRFCTATRADHARVERWIGGLRRAMFVAYGYGAVMGLVVGLIAGAVLVHRGVL